MLPGLDLHSLYICKDPAQHLQAADTGPAVHDLDHLDYFHLMIYLSEEENLRKNCSSLLYLASGLASL